MDTKKRFYWLWAAIGLLLLLNLATVGWVVRKVNTIRANRQNAAEIIVRRLAFTPDQLRQFRQSRSQMQRQQQPHEDSLRLLRAELFSRIKQPMVADDGVNQLLEQMAHQNAQITRLRFRHWQQVRTLGTPEQQAQFDKLMKRMERGLDKSGQVGLRERLRERF
jgi:periplasmic protein CpxP/Spy